MEDPPGLHKSTQILAKTFEDNYREEMLNRVHLVTTFWDHVEPGVGEERRAYLERHSWQRFFGQGSMIQKFELKVEGGVTSPKGILDTVVRGNVGEVADLHIPTSVSKVGHTR